MKKLISIKEARLKKGISLIELSKALKLDISLIESIDEGLQLPNRYKSYKANYERSIYNYLGYTVPHNNYYQNIPHDYTKTLLTFFFLTFALIILFFSSFNIYTKYNNQPNTEYFEEDYIYSEIRNFVSEKSLSNIDHQDFLNLLSLGNRIGYDNRLTIYANNLGPIYFKVKNMNSKIIEFGELLQLNKIVFDLNNDFLIDLSNIAHIEKLLYQGVEISIKNNFEFYLKDFNITELNKLQ